MCVRVWSVSVSGCVCVGACVSVCRCICWCMCRFVCGCMCVGACVCACVCVRVWCTCMCVFVFARVWVRVCGSVCVVACTNANINNNTDTCQTQRTTTDRRTQQWHLTVSGQWLSVVIISRWAGVPNAVRGTTSLPPADTPTKCCVVSVGNEDIKKSITPVMRKWA